MNTCEKLKCRRVGSCRPWHLAAVYWAFACFSASCWTTVAALGAEAGPAASPAKKPLIWLQAPSPTQLTAVEGRSGFRLCMKILKDEAARLGIELSADPKRMKESDGTLCIGTSPPNVDMPCVDVMFFAYRGYCWGRYVPSDNANFARKRYLLAFTNDAEWLRTGLRVLKAAAQIKKARICIVTDEAGAADTADPQFGTTFHAVPAARLEAEIGKVNDSSSKFG